ncbi:putative ankyrin repeat protein RF_0381 [Haliotis rufescens]|uniref:putative ankyrin repeat protein RF_0381 n=1 Tax=Haliotis rufescens TaxID=6454 RepID=UPI00201ECD37|nr:putative ankyrin repeat protein RF_0381 [Haliotis rufescens]
MKMDLEVDVLESPLRRKIGGKQFSPERYIQDKPCDQEGRSMDNQLHDACWEGDLNMVRRILSEGQLDVNSRDRRERTPVMAAACAGHKDVVKLLINAGSNVSLVEDHGYNIFHIATCIGHLGMVKYILSQNILDINSRTKCNRTPVMMAANRGYRDVFAVLVSKGADVSLRDQRGNNILLYTCAGGQVEMVKYVLSMNKVDINRRGQHGWTSVMVAARLGNREIRDRRERTPVMAAACAGHKDVVKLLINAGSNVSLVEDHGYNILHIATCIGHVAMVKYILSQNILDINSRTKCNRTPVMMAANRSYRNVLAVLVSEGADVSLRDRRGNNILHYTCAGGQMEMVKYVLSLNKVDINRRGQHGWTSVMVAARLGNREMLDLLMSKGSNVSLTAKEETNILHAACIGGHLEMVKYVVSQYFVDINSRRWNGKTALMISAQWAHREVFDFILRRGGNMSMVTYNGENILHLVCTKGTLDMVKYIFSKNLLNINARTKQGDTAALIAKRRKNS